MDHPAQEPDAGVSAAEGRRRKWRDLPPPVVPEDTTTSEDAAPPAPDLVDDPDHEFFIRHAG